MFGLFMLLCGAGAVVCLSKAVLLDFQIAVLEGACRGAVWLTFAGWGAVEMNFAVLSLLLPLLVLLQSLFCSCPMSLVAGAASSSRDCQAGLAGGRLAKAREHR